MISSLKKYKVRSGTIDEGKEYEFQMTTLLALRCIQHTKNVLIAFNAEGVGDFDDIVLMLTMENNDRFDFLLQLKHKADPNNLTKKELEGADGKLPFKKYSEHMVTLRMDLESESEEETIIKDLSSFSNIYFVLFTNRGMDMTKFKNNKFLFYEIDKDDSQKTLLKKLLNTYSSKHCVFKFISKIPPTISSEDNDNFTNFRFFTNQINLKDLQQEISTEIRKIVPFTLLKKDEKNIAEEFIKYVQNWAKGDLGGHYYLTKDDILFKLTELYLGEYEVNLRPKQLKNCDYDENNIWNKLVLDKTVTIIDSDETVMHFIIQFISNEVGKYCKGFTGKWSDKLCEDKQQLFYHDHDNLKHAMLKIVGNRGKIGLIDIYKCIWRMQKLPLLLEIQDSEEYDNILSILKLSDYSYNVIILNRTSSPLSKHENIKIFQTLQDLNQKEQDMVLDQPTKLQGRLLPKLGNLLDDTMFEYIKSNDIISILSGTYSIGEKIKSLPEYFIHRNTTKIFIRTDIFDRIYDEVFLLNNCEESYLDKLPKESNLIFSVENETNTEKIKELKALKRNIHYYSVYNDKYLQWKWTMGSTEKIRPFKVNLKDAFESDISYYFSNQVNIISEVPGMGKSVLMDYIARETRTSKWVLRIDLNCHLRYYRRHKNCKNPNTKAEEHLSYFFDEQGNNNNTLTQRIFQKLLNKKDVIVLLDGFDEISISYKKEVTNIAMSLKKGGYYVWLTTRPHMQKHLEEQFDTFAISLQPFTIDNQRTFLVDYFSGRNMDLAKGCERRIEEFVESLLVATKKNLYDYEAKFTGIPLQTELLADYFNSKCKDCLSHSGVIKFKKFDLLDLYENFVNKKLDELEKKFDETALKESEECRKDQPLLALQLVFPLEDFEEIDDIKKVDEYYKINLDKKQHLQRDGVITIDEKFNMSCNHRTFAEYLAAKWLADNLKTNDEQLQEFVCDLIKQRFTNNYQFLFNIFDRILAQNREIHMSIINGQFDKAKKMINSNSVNDLDEGRRTILHILALYDYEDLLSNNKNSNILEILQKIPNIRKLSSKRDALGYTALDYALANNSSLILANALCEHANMSPINACVDLNSCWLYLSKCEEFGLKPLFDLLLPYFVSRDLLQNPTFNKSANMKYYLKGKSYDIKSEYVKGLVSYNILEFLLSKRGCAYTGYANNRYSNLRYAICFGNRTNVEEVVSKKEINKKDVNSNTPLHYAVINQKLEIMTILLTNGADVNKKNSTNQTPLHVGFVTRNLDIINLLLSKNPNFNAVDKKGQNVLHYAVIYSDHDMVNELIGKVDINKQDNEGNIPLHLALQENKLDVAKLLIDNSSDLHILNSKNESALHYVIRYDCNNIVNKQLFKNVNKNVQDVEGNTALHLELNKSSVDVDTVKFLIDTGAEVNIQNLRKETPLHLAFNNPVSFNSIIIELLFDRGADVNIKNNLEESAIHCAIKSGNTSVLPKLLTHFQEVNQRNCFGDTYLHLASKNGESETVKLLISRGVNFNGLNDERESPLHLAVQARSTDTMSVLLANGALVNKKDKNGNTPLHLAITDNNVPAVELLVARDTDVTIKNKKGKSSLDLAHNMGNKKIIALLSRDVKNKPNDTFHKKQNSNNRRRGRQIQH